MTAPDPSWRDALAASIQLAPDGLRALASAELYIGGFTNVRLAHPVLDLREIADEARAADALVFFAAAALLRDQALARVHVRREHSATLPRRAKRALPGVLLRVDDENARLLRYFDLYLLPAAEVGDAAGAGLVTAVARALGNESRGGS